MISPEDLDLFQYADDPQTAFEILKTGLTAYARSRKRSKCRPSRNREIRRSPPAPQAAR